MIALSKYEPLPFHAVDGAEVHEVTHGHPGDAHVVEQLGLMLGCQLLHGLHFHKNSGTYQQVRDVGLLQLFPLVEDRQLLLRMEGKSAQVKLVLQRFLVDLFKEPAALLTMDFEDCGEEIVALLIERIVLHKTEEEWHH